jgi:hypothetical protein
MAVNFPESRVLQIWQDCPGRADLRTEEDGPVRVIYPGRLNDDRGADFRDAVIETRRGRLTGDIEIHLKSSYWWAHRHHLDPVYNRVILHVVFWRDAIKTVNLENGQQVPTLALTGLFGTGDNQCLLPISPLPCRILDSAWDNSLLPGILEIAGEQRFRSRAAGFMTISSPAEAGQILYCGVMAALGYAKNKYQMTELAGRMPLRRLESLVPQVKLDTECLARFQAMLLGTAGLLPSQRAGPRVDNKNERWVEGLERLWSAAGGSITMSEKDWHFFRVRPGNFPTRRIAAMSLLLHRYRETGLLNGLIDKLYHLPA